MNGKKFTSSWNIKTLHWNKQRINLCVRSFSSFSLWSLNAITHWLTHLHPHDLWAEPLISFDCALLSILNISLHNYPNNIIFFVHRAPLHNWFHDWKSKVLFFSPNSQLEIVRRAIKKGTKINRFESSINTQKFKLHFDRRHAENGPSLNEFHNSAELLLILHVNRANSFLHSNLESQLAKRRP